MSCCCIVFEGRKPGEVDNGGDVTKNNGAPIFCGMALTFLKLLAQTFLIKFGPPEIITVQTVDY